MPRLLFALISLLILMSCNPRLSNGLRKKDLTKDVEMITDKGIMIIRLSDATPLHRDNFLKLVKEGYYDSLLFHRVIKHFMIQGGDPNSKHAGPEDLLGEGGPPYTIPAEFRISLFHHKGVIAAAREGDQTNPQKASSGSQFYIVQGRVFTDAGLDSVETFRLNGRKIPDAQRQVYKTIGGSPHLDQNYTVFGEVIKGLNVIDSIAAMPVSKPYNRPVKDIRIMKVKLVRRSK
ncbi:MAG TPA: peptidylprolyl isomerase [Puia sp.]|nr:peptidylprolyl isomerase [Puia sp.]